MKSTMNTTNELPAVLTVAELAHFLKIGMNSAYNLVRSNAVRSIRIGRQIRIPKQAVEDYLNDQ